ncbi:MAG TPA: SprT-like domain-containing protein [Gemmatimonadaceae bacterium]|nr:SprT-like domain-containing protein [Gemmatimonadaceae bacterium]
MLRPVARPRDIAPAHPTQLTLVLRSAPRTAEDLFTRLRALGLRRITRCRLTNNRNVMVSFGANELRVHEGYLDAPDEVLFAIVRFVEGTTRSERLRARRRLLEYPIETQAPVRPRNGTHPDDQRLAERLTEWHARYNEQFFGGALRALQVRVSRRMRARLGHYTAATRAGEPAEIAISRRHLRAHGWDEALHTLLHEMVHQWQDERGMAIDHGRTFRKKAREIGISPLARRTVAA